MVKRRNILALGTAALAGYLGFNKFAPILTETHQEIPSDFNPKPKPTKKMLKLEDALITAYTPGKESCEIDADGRTATNYQLKGFEKVVAVDFNRIKKHSLVCIPGYTSGDEFALAIDTGGAMREAHRKGKTHIDTLYQGKNALKRALQWGRRTRDVEVFDAPTHFFEYTAKKGETLPSIKKQFPVNEALIAYFSQLPSTTIRTGTKLKIPIIPGTGNIHARYDAKGNLRKKVRGESLTTIARQYGINVSAIQKANGIEGKIRYGQELIIPRNPDIIPESELLQSSNYSTYFMRKGDAISTLAKKEGVSTKGLYSYNAKHGNPLPPARKFRVGQKVLIPQQYKTTPQTKASIHPPKRNITQHRIYTIRSGDTLSEVAEGAHITTHQLYQFNKRRGNTLPDPRKLQIGQKVYIPR